ncbi:ABC1 kinase family protein [Maribacter sp. ACAM166]|uniref:ABC1 kinase family protein n=1 Tax=Maribacter sp. ACAM166 TaxID=2508996 RepID=UPI0010FDEF47|nr:AarF/ABC1/UbiB kinase family protein [Maribacter sp. ACAM166]TLP81747.1 AarF/ABC1/UbiB kinase family protein [Maribacter sp. ACAM166]
MLGINLPKKRELKRYNKLFSVLAKYGFEDVVAQSGLRKVLPASYLKKHPNTDRNISFSKFERIRMVLEELGPSYVKLGQIFSNREDMLPPGLIKELEKLQDHVPHLQNFDVQKAIESELNIKMEDHFRSIELEPLAAASLAQVHKAQLQNGEIVALKIQRPNITETIEADIAVMKQIAGSLEKHSIQAKAFQPMRIVESFEQSIHEELQFLKEIDHIERFAHNFEGNGSIYVPKVYRELSTDKLICMEYIEGIKISEIDRLKALNIDCTTVAKVGVDLYLEQVLEHGFFHADPHPGNLFVLTDRDQLCFLDFGMMGTLLPKDKELLGDLLLHFTRKDIKKLIPILEDIAEKTDIPDYKKLEQDLNALVQGISDTSIQNIKLGATLTQFKSILYGNNIILPHNLYLLIRALIIMEGVGLRLDPEFNITDNLKPYMAKLTRKRFGLKRLFKKNLARLQDFSTLVDSLPDDLNTILKKIKDGKLVVVHEHKGLKEFQTALSKATNRLVFAVIIAALSIGSSILVIAKMPPLVNGVPLLGAIGFVLSAILGFLVVISIFKNNQF